MIKLSLERPKRMPPGYEKTQFPWASCAPFVENRRGILVHRPRTVSTFVFRKRSHFSIGYWCGSCANNDAGNITFLEAPSVGAIVCQRCEQAAIAAGLPSSSDLAGRHVHIGKLKAVLTCGCAQEQGESDGM